MKILAIGANVWAKADTEAEAIEKARKLAGWGKREAAKKPWLIYSAPDDTFVDDAGGMCWESDEERPVMIARIRDGQRMGQH